MRRMIGIIGLVLVAAACTGYDGEDTEPTTVSFIGENELNVGETFMFDGWGQDETFGVTASDPDGLKSVDVISVSRSSSCGDGLLVQSSDLDESVFSWRADPQTPSIGDEVPTGTIWSFELRAPRLPSGGQSCASQDLPQCDLLETLEATATPFDGPSVTATVRLTSENPAC